MLMRHLLLCSRHVIIAKPKQAGLLHISLLSCNTSAQYYYKRKISSRNVLNEMQQQLAVYEPKKYAIPL